jgi:secondary thiamine-phosphate synthase enzyme
MRVVTAVIELDTAGGAEVAPISAQVATALAGSDLHSGILTVFAPSATSALTTLEYEPGCVSDLQRLFDEIADPERVYQHNINHMDGNGHSHIRAALLGPSLTIPLVDGAMTLGQYQEIVYVDFDNRVRHRRLIVQMIGESRAV